MCLAVPGTIVALRDDATATVDMLGVQRDISVALTPDAKVGDYVLVHAGFGIQVIDPEEARLTLEIFQEIPELVGEELEGVVPFGSAAEAAADGGVPQAEPAQAAAQAGALA